METPSENSLVDLLDDLESSLKRKILEKQSGVPTFFDKFLLSFLLHKVEKDHSVASAPDVHKASGIWTGLLFRYSQFKSRTRLIGYAERAAETESWTPLPWEMNMFQRCATQGVTECLSWRGLPIFKSIYDFALYPMLFWNVRPSTVLELGSGSGASALWFADLIRLSGTNGHIYSIDLHRPALDDPCVSFIEGDCLKMETIFDAAALQRMPHPWLVIEDMHQNTIEVLRYFSRIMSPGDYLIVEDSLDKLNDLAVFGREHGQQFKVDTLYTDFFGRNATCSVDSIFRRV